MFKAFCDLEPIYSYEGTYEINALVTGREITKIAAIKPSGGKTKTTATSEGLVRNTTKNWPVSLNTAEVDATI